MKKLLTLLAIAAAVAGLGFNAPALANGWVTGAVLDADGNGVAGAQVGIQGVDRVRGQRPYMARAESGENGAFGFRDVPAGRYIVTAMTRELGCGRAEAVVEDNAGVEVTIRLQGRRGGGGGGEEPELEFGSISGTVTFNDEPVEAARVVAAPVRLNHRRGFVRARLTTDTDGNGAYSFADVPVGNWVVMAMKREVGMGRGRAEVIVDENTEVNITLIGRQR
ncbi:MAG: carboxypeptidase regulatory-like domain-containing protein [Calditrichaeota bacterium]|nr:carboxypeptidase regulatory-like domain-containing protein [Calditrichota bacterium]